MPKNVGFHCISVDFARQQKNSRSMQPTVYSVFYSLVWTSLDKTLGEIWSAREDLNLRPPTPHDGALPGCATCRRVGNNITRSPGECKRVTRD